MPRVIESLDDNSRQVLCERCRKFVSISNIKYMPKGNDSRMALCVGCLSKFNAESALSKKRQVEAKAISPSPMYFCTRCRYKFKFDSQKNATLRCPYCGKQDRLTEDKYTTADAILKDSNF